MLLVCTMLSCSPQPGNRLMLQYSKPAAEADGHVGVPAPKFTPKFTAATAPREPDDAMTAISTASYRTAVPAWSADRNADGACGAGCSLRAAEAAGKPTEHQSAFRHSRGWDNPNTGSGAPQGQALICRRMLALARGHRPTPPPHGIT